MAVAAFFSEPALISAEQFADAYEPAVRIWCQHSGEEPGATFALASGGGCAPPP